MAPRTAAGQVPESINMGFISRFLLLLCGSCALLVGIQVPGFVDQYEKRIDAHFVEVQTNLKPFQDIADKFHGGSLDALIRKHEASPDQSFRAEGDAIRKIEQRFQLLQREKIALQTSLPRQVVHMATEADRGLIEEARRDYSFTVLLNQVSLISGLIFAVGVVLCLELILGIFRWMWQPRRNPLRN